jgi:ABC-2 type transport system ATP-binding protein
MEEADSLADRVGIIDQGRVVSLGSSMELKTRLLDAHTIIVKGWNITQNAIAIMQRRYSSVKIEGGTLSISDRFLDLHDIIEQLHREGVNIRAAYFKEPTLEDVFLKITGKELRA